MTKLTKIESELDVYDDDHDDDGGNEKFNFFNENFEANYPSYGGILDLNVRHRHTLSLSLSLSLFLALSTLSPYLLMSFYPLSLSDTDAITTIVREFFIGECAFSELPHCYFLNQPQVTVFAQIIILQHGNKT